MNEAENAATFDEIFDLTAGDLPAQRLAELERLAETDRELAAKIAFVRQFNPPDTQLESQPDTAVAIPIDVIDITKKRRPLLRNRRLVAALLVAVLLGTGASITWAILYEPPLFSDDFDDNWFDPTYWANPRPGVKELNQHLWLQNRGCVVTQKEFSEPIAISFRWQWIDLAERPAYSEVLAVGFRTTGTMRQQYPFEINDGLVITIDAQEGAAYLSQAIPGQRGRIPLASSGTERVPLPAYEWLDVRIIDDGSTISLYLRGPTLGEKYWTKPVLRAKVDPIFQGKRIAIYNREIVEDAPHLSQIDDFVVHRISAEPESGIEQ